VFVSSNGFLTFDNNSDTAYEPSLTPTSDPSTIIAGLWSDLNPAHGYFQWKTVGHAPFRKWVGTWINTEYYELVDGDFRLIPLSNYFQFVLEEKTNQIEVHYLLLSDPERDVEFDESNIFVGIQKFNSGPASSFGLSALWSTDNFRVNRLWNGEQVFGTSFTIAYSPPLPRTFFCPGPDAFGYTCEKQKLEWIDTSQANIINLGDDDEILYLPLGFGFNFYGTWYDSVGLSDNGYLTLRGSVVQNSPLHRLPAFEIRTIIAGFWADFDFVSGGFFSWDVQGLPGFRRWIGSWHVVPYFSVPGSVNTFQIVLEEETSNIRVNYFSLDNPPSFRNMLIGIQDYVVSNVEAFFSRGSQDGTTTIFDNSPIFHSPLSIVFHFPAEKLFRNVTVDPCATTGTTGKPQSTTGKSTICADDKCCINLQNPNEKTGQGFLQANGACTGPNPSQNCVDGTGCELCFNPQSGGPNKEKRPVCNRFIPSTTGKQQATTAKEATSKQATTAKQVTTGKQQEATTGSPRPTTGAKTTKTTQQATGSHQPTSTGGFATGTEETSTNETSTEFTTGNMVFSGASLLSSYPILYISLFLISLFVRF